MSALPDTLETCSRVGEDPCEKASTEWCHVHSLLSLLYWYSEKPTEMPGTTNHFTQYGSVKGRGLERLLHGQKGRSEKPVCHTDCLSKAKTHALCRVMHLRQRCAMVWGEHGQCVTGLQRPLTGVPVAFLGSFRREPFPIYVHSCVCKLNLWWITAGAFLRRESSSAFV